jgi:hypothetical protein
MKFLLIVCLLILMCSTVYAVPISYTVSSGKSSYTETMQNPSMSINTDVFENFIGKRIQIDASHTGIAGWVVRVEDIQGFWLIVTGEDGYQHYINANYIQAFNEVK